MLINTFSLKWTIDYNVLRKYHFESEILFESYIKQGKLLVREVDFEIPVRSETPEKAKDVLVAFGNFFLEFGIAEHLPNIVYLTQKIIEFEGNVKNELKDYSYILGELDLLSSLLSLRDDKKTKLTLEHKNYGKRHEHYIILDDNNKDLIPLAVDALVDGVLKRIKRNKSQLPNNFAIMEESFDTITLDKVSELKMNCVDVSEKTFDSLLLYTISKTLQKYLNNETTLSKEGATLTNDQARVIYATCEFYGLITEKREMDYDKVNYMKSVFKNKTEDQSIKINLS